MTHVFVVEEAERKTTSTGKNYARAKVAGMGWASLWDANDANLVLSNVGKTFKGEMVEKDGFKNLSGLSIAADGEPTTTTDSDEKMSKGDWDAKESREAFRIAWAVVYKTERDNQVFPDAAMERALEFAEQVGLAAWNHARTEKVPF
jgi:hypothetical protein